VHLACLIIRTHHDARSPECQNPNVLRSLQIFSLLHTTLHSLVTGETGLYCRRGEEAVYQPCGRARPAKATADTI